MKPLIPNPHEFTRTHAYHSPRVLNWIVFVLVVLSFTAPYHVSARSLEAVEAARPAMQQLSLEGFRRVLVISPHPDDETIAPGGLIQMALSNGSRVRVVMVTNGDGQFGAPVIFGLDDPLAAQGYIAMGEQRQAESQAALVRLGVPAEDILFLGYPDRGIGPMLDENWDVMAPYTAPFTRATVSPYTKTYHPQAAYCGENLLADLTEIVNAYRPDLIVLSHPSDTHSDHSAVSRFTSLAVDSVQTAVPAYQPQMWAYLVHYGDYPNTAGEDQISQFIPPANLTAGGEVWGTLALTPAQSGAKSTAIQAYPTQTLLLGNFLPEFIRSNEIFMLLPEAG